MELKIVQWLFQGIPECLALAGLGVALAGRPLEPKMVFSVGLPQAVVAYLVRLLPITFGVHTLLLVVSLAILLNVLLKIRFSRGLLSALVAVIILATAEMAFISLALSVTGITFEQARQDIFLLIVYGWPHTVFLFLLALGLNRYRQSRRRQKGGA